MFVLLNIANIVQTVLLCQKRYIYGMKAYSNRTPKILYMPCCVTMYITPL